ncbi:hypothetical protein HAX54_024018 [Datura stramonium]|uniref:GAG-pre-integrase domain-containing protein n=1 Tax=Datura stramonium TaxID=4076 RepID=A0ABS8S5M3_DATST|nr:hypothetical protein [Datura stramonium]
MGCCGSLDRARPKAGKEVALSGPWARDPAKLENASSYNEVELWHRRLGHLHVSKMRVLVPSLSESGVSELQAPVQKLPVPIEAYKSDNFLE